MLYLGVTLALGLFRRNSGTMFSTGCKVYIPLQWAVFEAQLLEQ